MTGTPTGRGADPAAPPSGGHVAGDPAANPALGDRATALSAALRAAPVVGIVRLPHGVAESEAITGTVAAIGALADGGIRAAEVTLTTPGALTAISEAVARHGDRIVIGAGSVRSAAEVEAALGAGARFLVTPTVAPAVLSTAAPVDLPVICGGLTPTELAAATDAGAWAVKVFPAGVFGAGYLREVLAPMPHLRLVPTGGITAANVADYARAGAVAVAAGSALVDPALVQSGAWTGLTRRAAAFVAAWHNETTTPHPTRR